MPEQPLSPDNLARRLEEALATRRPTAPLSDDPGLADLATAYEVQRSWTRLRMSRGERLAGRKVGLTSAAMQEQLGVHQPDYGALWASRHFSQTGGRAEVPLDLFIQPRVEAEIVFLLDRPLRGPHATPADVLSATGAVAVGIEVIDSRIADWRIKITDTIADNASFGGFLVGPWSSRMRGQDLRLVGMLLRHNGQPAVQSIGAAVLGHPARAVAWLVNTLADFDEGLDAGDMVFSGSLGRAIPVRPGDLVTLEMAGFPPLSVHLAKGRAA
jgi:2-keto-4-pentenoate hydratase